MVAEPSEYEVGAGGGGEGERGAGGRGGGSGVGREVEGGDARAAEGSGGAAEWVKDEIKYKAATVQRMTKAKQINRHFP